MSLTKIEMNFMNTLILNSVRIADALERIAKVMEEEKKQKDSTSDKDNQMTFSFAKQKE
jgi:hypothetical protein